MSCSQIENTPTKTKVCSKQLSPDCIKVDSPTASFKGRVCKSCLYIINKAFYASNRERLIKRNTENRAKRKAKQATEEAAQ